MTSVLVPIDGSERALHALPLATRLAGPRGTVLLVRVVPPEPAYAEAILSLAGSGQESVSHIQQQWQAIAGADLDEAAQLIAASGVVIERSIAAGEPEEAIVQVAHNHGVDMIVMASHGRGAIGRAIFGSVADRVARTAPVPVLIERVSDEQLAAKSGEATVRRILLPLDGSERAAQALPVAAKVAQTLDVPVYVVRVVDPANNVPISTGTLGPAPSVAAEVADRLWQEAENQARETVKSAIADLQKEGISASGATLNGSPFFAISDVATPDDLIILTSHGRGGLQRWLLGSVAEKLVREAPAPVLLVPTAERVAAATGS